MAYSIRVAQPIRLQHLHKYTSRILLIEDSPKHSLVRFFIIHLLLVLRTAKRNPSKNRKFCRGYAILLTTVENNRRHNQNHGHEKLNTSFSFHGELFWKITVTASDKIAILERKTYFLKWPQWLLRTFVTQAAASTSSRKKSFRSNKRNGDVFFLWCSIIVKT